MSGSPLRRGFAANAAGQLVATAAPLATVPVFLATVGVAGFGLIGLIAALSAALSAFTRGLGWALQRDTAQAWAHEEGRGLRPLVRTYEAVFLSISIALSLLVVALAGPLARLIGDSSQLPDATVQTCVALLGLKVLGALPFGAYQAVLLGSGRHVLVNALFAGGVLATAVGTVTAAVTTGSVVTIVLVDGLGWLGLCLAMRVAVQHVLPDAEGAARLLSREEVVCRIPLNLGLLWTHGTGLVISQVDRLAVGAQLSLDAVGSYSPAAVAGRSLRILYSPYLTASFPGLCRAAAREGDHAELLSHVRRSTAATALLAGSAGVVLALFAFETLSVWTRQEDLAARASASLVLAAAAGVALGQADTLYQVHVALGRSKVPVALNTAAVCWFPVATVLLVRALGIEGAALSFLLYASVQWVGLLVSVDRLVPGAAVAHLGQVASCLMVPVAAGVVARVAVELAGRQQLLSASWSRLLAGTALTVGLVSVTVYLVRRRRRASAASGPALDHASADAPPDATR